MGEELSISFVCKCGNRNEFLITMVRGGDSGTEHAIVVECDDCGVEQRITA
jgi:hypothetical protein